MYIYIHTYVHTYKQIYTYMHTQTHPKRLLVSTQNVYCYIVSNEMVSLLNLLWGV